MIFGDFDNMPHISSVTEIFVLSIAYTIRIFLTLYCIFLIFTPFNAINWTLHTIPVIIFSIIFVDLYAISALIQKLVEKRSRLDRCKCFSLIGHGGIALCGIVPRILVFFVVGNNLHLNWYIAFISIATSILISYVLIQPNSKHFEVCYLDGSTSSIWKKYVVLHIIVLIITIRIAIALFEVEDIFTIILCQFVYSFICVPSIFDFYQVLSGRIKLTDKDGQKQAMVTGNAYISKETTVPKPENEFKLECKACTMEYSETRIPRILRECGHTVCEGCANELLKKNNQKYLCCPFCQEITLVKGPANLLAKNYTVLEAVEKMK